MKSTWTKELVQQHAKVAVAIELYTLPFYISAAASVKDTSSDAYNIIVSVFMEEMLHLELAANLCLALDTTPNFTAPVYGRPVPFIKPFDPETGDRGFLNARIGPLNQKTLDLMLDIETPEDVQVNVLDHTTPQYPYNSIGEMYDALLAGIAEVGPAQFSWTTTNQQVFWGEQAFPQKIVSYKDAVEAVQTIIEQGEGKAMDPAPQPPYTAQEFPIPKAYQLQGEKLDPAPGNAISHFGRFIEIQNAALPDIYMGRSDPSAPKNRILQTNFAALITQLNDLWAGVSGASIWHMTSLLDNTYQCWKAGITPEWSTLP